MTKFLKYLAAFVSGYAAALVPLLANGTWPTGSELISAILPGVVATGLLHLPTPASGPTKSN